MNKQYVKAGIVTVFFVSGIILLIIETNSSECQTAGLISNDNIPNCSKGVILLIIGVISVFVMFPNYVGLSALRKEFDID